MWDSPPPPHPTPSRSRRQSGRGGGGMGWGGRGIPLWVYFHIGYMIVDIQVCIQRANSANIVPFTKQLHIRFQAARFRRSGVKSHFALISRCKDRSSFDNVLETQFQRLFIQHCIILYIPEFIMSAIQFIIVESVETFLSIILIHFSQYTLLVLGGSIVVPLLLIPFWALATDPFLVSCATSSTTLLPRRRKPLRMETSIQRLPPPRQQHR